MGDKELQICSHNEIAKRIGYVPQVSSGALSGTVIDFILLGRRQYLNWRLKEEDLLAVMDVLERLNIREFANRDFGSLSGGQRQKVLVARALLQTPELYIFDEPTSNLDLKNQIEIMQTLLELNRQEGVSVLMVLHDINLAGIYCDRLIMLKDGQVIAAGNTNECLCEENLKKLYDISFFHMDTKKGQRYYYAEI